MNRDHPKFKIRREHVLQAIIDLDSGIPTEFHVIRKFELQHNGKRYVPRAVISRAAFVATGKAMELAEFNKQSPSLQAHNLLSRLGFTIGPRSEPSPAKRWLSKPQWRALGLLLRGESPSGVAVKMELSEHTVRDYVRTLYRVFAVGSRRELLGKWLQMCVVHADAAALARLLLAGEIPGSRQIPTCFFGDHPS